MGFGWVDFRPLIQSGVNRVEFRAEVTVNVEPPIAHEHSLAELGTVRAQEGGLAAVDVAVVPGLAACLHVGEESGIRLVFAVEICIWHHGEDWVIGARSTCGQKFSKCSAE